jgi:glycosyltransferase involved in cell wall biosynthesis
MRITQILSGREMNGAVRHCFMLCDALAERGHEVTLVHRPQLQTGREVSARVCCVAAGFAHDPSGPREMAAIVGAAGAQVMHTHMSDAHAMGAILRVWRKVPSVATAHSRTVQLHWAFNDLVIAPSEPTARFHNRVNLVSRARIRTIPNFIDVAAIRPATFERRQTMRRKLGIADDTVVIVSVGNVVDYKRQSDLVRSFSRLVQFGVRCRLLLAGGLVDPGEVARVRREIRNGDVEPFVHLLGFTPDARDLLAAADIYAMSSRREEMPVAVLEAMAAGLPIVGPRVGGMPELVVDDLNGWLVGAGDVDELTIRLAALVGDLELRRQFGRESRERVVAGFSADPIVDCVEAALREVARPA